MRFLVLHFPSRLNHFHGSTGEFQSSMNSIHLRSINMVRPNLSTDGSGDGLMMLCTCHIYPPWLTFQTMFVRRSSRSSQSQAHLDFPNRRARIFHRLQCSAMRDIIKICFFISNLLELSTGSFECFFDGIRYVVLQLAMSFGLVSLGNVENIIFCACRKDCQ